MQEPPTNNAILQPEWFPLVKDEADAEAAYDAYSSLPSLLEYRAKHQGERAFLYDILGLQDEGPIRFREFTVQQVWVCVQLAANELGRSLPPRKRGEAQTIVAFIGRSGVDYVLNEWALQLLHVQTGEELTTGGTQEF